MYNPELRPLRIGEILDRAVALFVRRFASFVLILAIVAVPVAIVSYAAQPQTTATLSALAQVFSTATPGRVPDAAQIVRALSSSNRQSGLAIALLALGNLLGLLSTTACMIAVAQAAAGQLPSVREVYRAALRRWPAQLLAAAAFFAFAFVLFVVLVIGLTFASVGAVLALKAGGIVTSANAAWLTIPFVLVAGIAMLLLGALLFLSAQMTFVAIALEDPNPWRGIARGVARTFGRAILLRSLLVALSLFGISLVGSLILLAIGGLLAAVTHQFALYTVVVVVGSVLLNAILITFMVLYSSDLRVRREGYDLVLATERPAVS